MKRLLFWCSILLITGVYLGYFIYGPFVPFLALILIFVGAAKLFFARKPKKRLEPFLLIVSLLMGIFIIQIKDQTDDMVLKKFEYKTVIMKARVSGQPDIKDTSVNYTADVLNLKAGNDIYTLNEKILLSSSDTNVIPCLGDIIELRCRISPPYEPLNRGGFDYGLSLKTKNIFFVGYISDSSIKILQNKSYTFFDYFTLLNERLCNNINSVFDKDTYILMNAITLGQTASMDVSLYSAFRNSGLLHVVAVSGMHLSYLVMILFAFSKIFKIKKKLYSVIASFVIIFFVMLTGMSPSIMRAGIVALIVFSANLFTRRADPLTSLGIAAIILLFQNPFTAFNAGFILSFASTLGILLFTDRMIEFICRNKKIFSSASWLGRLLRAVCSVICVSFCGQLFTFPFIAFMNHELPIWSLFANLIITPLMPVLLFGGLLFCLLGVIYLPAAEPLAAILTPICTLFIKIVMFFGSMNNSVIRLGEIGIFFILQSLLFTIIIYLVITRKKQYLIIPTAAFLSLMIFYKIYSAAFSDYAYVTFINVGQGDCTLIELPNDIDILIDGGEYKYSADTNISSATINSYLVKNGIRNIDFMIASHSHSDHVNGLLAVMDNIDVENIIIPQNFGDDEVANSFISKAIGKNIPIYEFKAGSTLNVGSNIKLSTLMPDDYWANNTTQANDRSLVMRFDVFDTSFLFTGDLEATGERYMMRLTQDDLLDIDILKVAHHGSLASTTKSFLERTTPEFAFIPVGKNNFNHPGQELLDRLTEKGVTLFRADTNKDVLFILNKDGIENILFS